MQEILSEVNIPPDCEFLVAQIRDGRLQLMEAYRVHCLYPLEVHQVGNWTSAKGLQWKNKYTPTYKRRNNFHGLALRAAVSNVCHIKNMKLAPEFLKKKVPSVYTTLHLKIYKEV